MQRTELADNSLALSTATSAHNPMFRHRSLRLCRLQARSPRSQENPVRDLMSTPVDLSAAAARTIAAGMREVARVDGTHPQEEALLDLFEEDLPPGETVVDLTTLTDAPAKEAFLKSLVLVAYADGGVSAEERRVINGYAAALGMDTEALGTLFLDVAASLFSRLAGARIWKDEVAEIGREMGLPESAIQDALRTNGEH